MIMVDDGPENIGSTGPIVAGRKANRLAQEKSPYLMQHAQNPVDWYPWGEEAFERARSEDKPIFLSIGYSTCYWCHVMDRQVFENDEIAALMNRTVVSIKVDREERPDIDRVYMHALQAMTGNGGWPMSVFMTAERKPFYAATYIPPEDQNGRIGFPGLLMRIDEIWRGDRSTLIENGRRVTQYLIDSSRQGTAPAELTGEVLDRGYDLFERSYDSIYGGFGRAPKFPRPAVFNFLFRYYSRTGKSTARDMALTTLKKMAEGGINDQLGGGFHRYSTDNAWHVPHFEKMLYDQAQLVISFLEAFQISHDPFYAGVVHEVLAYVRDALTSPEGGFYSAEDAESAIPSSQKEKKEGAYYLWRKSEIDGVLTEEEGQIIELYFGIIKGGNVRSDPRREFAVENILSNVRSIREIAELRGEKPDDVQNTLIRAKLKLLDDRRQRPRPHRDDKILLSWNGLMISAFARAYCVLGDKAYLTPAVEAAGFILAKLYDGKTRVLLRRYREGEAKFDAQCADYAFFIQGLLDLYEASYDVEWLRAALELTEDHIRIFYDTIHGGFYETAGTDPTILVRTKEVYDGAEPSGNSVAIINLLRLSQLTDNPRYLELAKNSLASLGEHAERSPDAMPQFLVALDFSLAKPLQIILCGDRDHPVVGEMLREIHSRFIPKKILFLTDRKNRESFWKKHIPIFSDPAFQDETPKAYTCHQYNCQLPVSDTHGLARFLDRTDGGETNLE